MFRSRQFVTGMQALFDGETSRTEMPTIQFKNETDQNVVEKSHVMCHSGQIGLGPCNHCRCVNSNVHKGRHRDDFMTWKHFPYRWPLFIGNPPIPPHKYLAMLNFDVFFVIRLNYC